MGSILPADSYQVVYKTIVSDYDKNLITLLYQPIIGHKAVSLYLTLLDDLSKKEILSKEYTHHHLMSIMQISLEEIIIAREKLEAVGLIKTYFKEAEINSYVYVLYSPLSAHEFFNHPILNVVLYNNLGKSEYNDILNFFKVPNVNLKDYKDISIDFRTCFRPVSAKDYKTTENIIKKETAKLIINKRVDFDLLINSLPKNMISEKTFNKETKELIEALAYIYNIDNLTLELLVRNSINEKALIDKNELRKSARNYYQFENAGNLPTLIYSKQPEHLRKPSGESSRRAKLIYSFENISPYDYLKSKYRDAEPSQRELKLIEDLMINYRLKAGVINVLISFVLKINNQKFTRTYVEAIASQWNRLEIDTVEEAMDLCEKEYKKTKKSKAKAKTKDKGIKEELPNWFDEDINREELSESEQAELDNLFKEFK